jgi:hypothetical protein
MARAGAQERRYHGSQRQRQSSRGRRGKPTLAHTGEDTVTASCAPRRAVAGALGLYSLWVLLTYLLKGRQQTLLRPEVATLRLVYALVANLEDSPTCKVRYD